MQLLSVLAAAVWAGVGTFVLLRVVRGLVGLRASSSAEKIGIDLTEHAARRLTDIPAIELVTTPSLSVVAFRGPDNDTTQHIQNTLNGSGDVFVSSTTVDVQDCVRLAFLNQRTTQVHVDRAIDLVAEAMA